MVIKCVIIVITFTIVNMESLGFQDECGYLTFANFKK